jgi:hypothetical protein
MGASIFMSVKMESWLCNWNISILVNPKKMEKRA